MHRIGFVLTSGYSVMNFAAVAAFELANDLSGRDFYDIHFMSVEGGPLRTSVGMRVETTPFGAGDFDTLLVGGSNAIQPVEPAAADFVRDAAPRARRIASICTGAFVLAAAGLLDGRRATTHWLHARELKTRHPAVNVDEDRIFINDGPVWTSAGMTAGIDLALALIEQDFGPDLARAAARKLVVYHRRAGGQSQFSTLLELEPKSDRIQKALTFARQNLRTELTVEKLAEAAHLSPRQFSRSFQAETGQSPAKAVEHLRVEAARIMMEESAHPIDVVARETGFADRDRMRRAFLRAFGQPPQVLRRNARADEHRAPAQAG